jgi:micrococcal nuclease
VRVVDGDTLRLRVDGREEPVRLIGINTPESVDPRRPIECLGKEATAKTAELLKGVQTVEVEPDPTQDTRDAYARLLLYVWLPDGRLLNRELIASGYAQEYTFRTPYRFQAEFRQAQREAEAAGRGLWAPGACENQAPVSRSTPAPARPAAPATAPSAPKPTAATQAGRGVPPISKDDCPASHPVKGNQGSRSTADWIYHPPGSRSYAVTDPEECFATAADAEAAGYRAPRN